ncbi:hypothetical protein L195_g005622 [Trifolium pratense]|uniref:C2H2-type domain-containing protein n=1 Tax=Trifolium pratense TaxID=57577 RepID=A0A2K3P1C1_TRIPR|nr:hypothetical protein L195_g005622 [Trifolium pratense]
MSSPLAQIVPENPSSIVGIVFGQASLTSPPNSGLPGPPSPRNQRFRRVANLYFLSISILSTTPISVNNRELLWHKKHLCGAAPGRCRNCGQIFSILRLLLLHDGVTPMFLLCELSLPINVTASLLLPLL